MDKLRVGIIGVGGIFRCAHVSAYKNGPAEIVAMCDINEKKLKDADSLAGRKVKTYTDYKAMIDTEKLDMVDICTPNYLHSQIAVYALSHGVNVFCEKPDAIDVTEVLKMEAAAKESGKKLMVMRNNRHVNSSKTLKKMVENGEFGEIYSGRCGWIRTRGIPGKGGWFTTKEMSGGGPLIDLGVHMIDLAIYLMGNPKAVAVSGSTFSKFADNDEVDSLHSDFGEKKSDGVMDVEDLAMGFIKFDNGACLQIEFSWASNVKKEENFVELRGTKLGCRWCEGAYELYDGHRKSLFAKLKSKSDKVKQLATNGPGHQNNLRHFFDVLLNGASPDYEIAQGVNMIKILCAIYESAATGKEVLL